MCMCNHVNIYIYIYIGTNVMAEGFHEDIRPRDTLTRSHVRQQNIIVDLIGCVTSKGSRNNT